MEDKIIKVYWTKYVDAWFNQVRSHIMNSLFDRMINLNDESISKMKIGSRFPSTNPDKFLEIKISCRWIDLSDRDPISKAIAKGLPVTIIAENQGSPIHEVHVNHEEKS